MVFVVYCASDDYTLKGPWYRTKASSGKMTETEHGMAFLYEMAILEDNATCAYCMTIIMHVHSLHDWTNQNGRSRCILDKSKYV